MNIPRIVIAGTQSGVGKTSVALALMAAYRKRGLRVQPFKVGPDYIDPSYHRVATGLPSHNLDSWLLSKETVQELFIEKGNNCDIAIIEGVMGLFDGLGTKEETASTQEIAKLLQAPILLVIDAKGMSRSGAAMVLGYAKFDPSLKIAGVILNRVSSQNHYQILKESIEHYTGIPVLGGLYKNENLKIPERHLGLMTAEENPELQKCLDLLTELTVGDASTERPGFDLDRIIKIAQENSIILPVEKRGQSLKGQSPFLRIGVARDMAFSFYYQANLDLLEELGAELIFFSPLKDKNLPEDCSALYFGGGFPEIYAGDLGDNLSFIGSIKNAIQSALPIYAECGGLIYLSESIQTMDGRSFPMIGAVPGNIVMTGKLQNFGYKEGKLLKDTLLGTKGDSIRGHEFHYSVNGDSALFARTNRALSPFTAYELQGRRTTHTQWEGFSHGSILASYLHLHFYTDPSWAERFVESGREYLKKKEVSLKI